MRAEAEGKDKRSVSGTNSKGQQAVPAVDVQG